MSSTKSTFFFPLRTNVGYFDAPENYLSLRERIKQASLLYDQLVFEEGVYTAIILPTGSVDSWIPPDKISDDMLLSMHGDFRPTGGESLVVIQPDGGNR